MTAQCVSRGIVVMALILGFATDFYIDLSRASNRASRHTHDIRHGTAIILVTHEVDVAAAAGRQLTFRDGELLTDEPLDQQRVAVEGKL